MNELPTSTINKMLVYEILIPLALKGLGEFTEGNLSFLQGVLKGEIEMDRAAKERLAALLHIEDISLFEEEGEGEEEENPDSLELDWGPPTGKEVW